MKIKNTCIAPTLYHCKQRHSTPAQHLHNGFAANERSNSTQLCAPWCEKMCKKNNDKESNRWTDNEVSMGGFKVSVKAERKDEQFILRHCESNQREKQREWDD